MSGYEVLVPINKLILNKNEWLFSLAFLLFKRRESIQKDLKEDMWDRLIEEVLFI